jgi:hypothetical protein
MVMYGSESFLKYTGLKYEARDFAFTNAGF